MANYVYLFCPCYFNCFEHIKAYYNQSRNLLLETLVPHFVFFFVASLYWFCSSVKSPCSSSYLNRPGLLFSCTLEAGTCSLAVGSVCGSGSWFSVENYGWGASVGRFWFRSNCWYFSFWDDLIFCPIGFMFKDEFIKPLYVVLQHF